MKFEALKAHEGHYVLLVSETGRSFPCWLWAVNRDHGAVVAEETDVAPSRRRRARVLGFDDVAAVLPHPDGDEDGDGELFRWMADRLNAGRKKA